MFQLYHILHFWLLIFVFFWCFVNVTTPPVETTQSSKWEVLQGIAAPLLVVFIVYFTSLALWPPLVTVSHNLTFLSHALNDSSSPTHWHTYYRKSPATISLTCRRLAGGPCCCFSTSLSATRCVVHLILSRHVMQHICSCVYNIYCRFGCLLTIRACNMHMIYSR